MTLVNLEGMIKMIKVLKVDQMSNELLLKKSLLFALHLVNFNVNNDAPAATNKPQRLQYGRELPQTYSGRE